MRKSKNKAYRWIAAMLTMALLVGQCHVPVLAQEETAPVESGISDGDKAGAQESGDAGMDDDASKDGKEGGDQSGADNGGEGGEEGSTEGDSADNGSTEDGADNAGSGDSGDGSDNGGAGNDGEGESGVGDIGTGDEDIDKGGEEGVPDKCVCETACTEDTVNADCPVCAADYANCAQNAGEEANPPEGSREENTVSENDLAEEENTVLMAADEGVEALAVGDEFTFDGIRYVVTGDGEVEVGRQNTNDISGRLMIPNYVVDNNRDRYRVTSIGKHAFLKCSNLTSVTIPDSVTSIKYAAFNDCGITSVTISDSVTSIEGFAFAVCKRLRKVEIPEGVKSIEDYTFCDCNELTSITLPDSVTSIGEQAFCWCYKLTEIDIPKGVTSIGKSAFSACALTSVTIPESVTSIGNGAFSGNRFTSVKIPKGVTNIEDNVFAQCRELTRVIMSDNVTSIGKKAFWNSSLLKELDIVVTVPVDGDIKPPSVGEDAFTLIPDRRLIAFFSSNSADEGTKTALDKAKEVYIEAAKHDGDPNDDRWYGWFIGELPDIDDTYTVTVDVRRDDISWGDSGRAFALTKDSGATFTTDLDVVETGIYTIYDVTGLTADEFQTKGVNTGVSVSVVDKDVSATVDYYTATFYDGADAYKAGTPQEPQIVLRGQRVLKPTDPSKADYDFAGWKTTDGGSTPYDFATAVTDTTGIFASWVEKTAEQLHITASSAGGGTISPIGDISVTKGGEQTFTITPNEGHRIKTVTVDGRDATAELKDTLARAQTGARYYTFTNVTEDHTIHAAFESDGGAPGGDDKPDGNDTSGGGDNPIPGGGDGGTGDMQTTAVIQAVAPQAVNSAAGNPQTSGGAEQGAEKAAAPNGKEPKTGDSTPVEIYATVAMIAGLTYLLLYFMEEGRGMTEREKEVFVAAFIRWAKKGGRFRKCCAIAAIFCLLVYYHSIGKRAGQNGFDREYLRQAM